jgi:hypothetical protein
MTTRITETPTPSTSSPTGYGPIETCPNSLTPPHTEYDHSGPIQYRGALLQAVDGVELGTYDRRILDWLAGWDTSTVAVVVSLLHRVRAAGAAELEAKLNDTYYDMDVIREDNARLQASLDNLRGAEQ